VNQSVGRAAAEASSATREFDPQAAAESETASTAVHETRIAEVRDRRV